MRDFAAGFPGGRVRGGGPGQLDGGASGADEGRNLPNRTVDGGQRNWPSSGHPNIRGFDKATRTQPELARMSAINARTESCCCQPFRQARTIGAAEDAELSTGGGRADSNGIAIPQIAGGYEGRKCVLQLQSGQNAISADAATINERRWPSAIHQRVDEAVRERFVSFGLLQPSTGTG